MNLVKNTFLRTEILKRFEELDYTQRFIINDASERGMDIKPERLSKYLKGKPGGITEEQLVWLSTRLGIYVNINFGKAVFENGKLMYKVSRYDEAETLKMLNRIFPKKQ